MGKRAKISDIRQGKTLYRVQFGKIEKVQVTCRPYTSRFGGQFFKVLVPSCVRPGELVETEASLKDWNIIPNYYNAHMVFTSRRRAEKYAEEYLAGLHDDTRNDPFLDHEWHDPWYDECEYLDDLQAGRV